MDRTNNSLENVEIDRELDRFSARCAQLDVIRPPELLYHYTTVDGFRGIYGSQTLRLTEIRATNDSGEFQHGLSKFLEATNSLARFGFSSEYIEILKKVIDLHRTDPVGTFIGCFSEVADDHSQWQAYGDRGLGICMHFKTPEELREDDSQGTFLKVIYDQDHQNKIIQKCIDDLVATVSVLQQRFDLNTKDRQAMIASAYMRVAGLQSLRFKGNDWNAEREWRIFYGQTTPDRTVHPRDVNGRYCPYVVAKFDEYGIGSSAITIGSGCPEDKRSIVQSLCGSEGRAPFEIRSSARTLR